MSDAEPAATAAPVVKRAGARGRELLAAEPSDHDAGRGVDAPCGRSYTLVRQPRAAMAAGASSDEAAAIRQGLAALLALGDDR